MQSKNSRQSVAKQTTQDDSLNLAIGKLGQPKDKTITFQAAISTSQRPSSQINIISNCPPKLSSEAKLATGNQDLNNTEQYSFINSHQNQQKKTSVGQKQIQSKNSYHQQNNPSQLEQQQPSRQNKSVLYASSTTGAHIGQNSTGQSGFQQYIIKNLRYEDPKVQQVYQKIKSGHSGSIHTSSLANSSLIQSQQNQQRNMSKQLYQNREDANRTEQSDIFERGEVNLTAIQQQQNIGLGSGLQPDQNDSYLRQNRGSFKGQRLYKQIAKSNNLSSQEEVKGKPHFSITTQNFAKQRQGIFIQNQQPLPQISQNTPNLNFNNLKLKANQIDQLTNNILNNLQSQSQNQNQGGGHSQSFHSGIGKQQRNLIQIQKLQGHQNQDQRPLRNQSYHQPSSISNKSFVLIPQQQQTLSNFRLPNQDPYLQNQLSQQTVYKTYKTEDFIRRQQLPLGQITESQIPSSLSTYQQNSVRAKNNNDPVMVGTGKASEMAYYQTSYNGGHQNQFKSGQAQQELLPYQQSSMGSQASQSTVRSKFNKYANSASAYHSSGPTTQIGTNRNASVKSDSINSSIYPQNTSMLAPGNSFGFGLDLNAYSQNIQLTSIQNQNGMPQIISQQVQRERKGQKTRSTENNNPNSNNLQLPNMKKNVLNQLNEPITNQNPSFSTSPLQIKNLKDMGQMMAQSDINFLSQQQQQELSKRVSFLLDQQNEKLKKDLLGFGIQIMNQASLGSQSELNKQDLQRQKNQSRPKQSSFRRQKPQDSGLGDNASNSISHARAKNLQLANKSNQQQIGSLEDEKLEQSFNIGNSNLQNNKNHPYKEQKSSQFNDYSNFQAQNLVGNNIQGFVSNMTTGNIIINNTININITPSHQIKEQTEE